MTSKLKCIVSELRKLKRRGIKTIPLSEKTWSSIQSYKPRKAAPKKIHKPELSKDPAPVVDLDIKAPAISTEAPRVKFKAPKEEVVELPDAPSVELSKASKQEQWEVLKNQVLSCETCLKHTSAGNKLVFGSGNLDADVFFCGDVPAIEDAQQGQPFVGESGQLLTKIIQAMGLSRDRVYLANVMPWRPEAQGALESRNATQAELEFCLPYLKGQVDVVKPKVFIALGAMAVSALLGRDSKRRMGQVRGNWQSWNETELMITYHPSYLIRNSTLRVKRQLWEDMMLVMDKVNLPISERQQKFFL